MKIPEELKETISNLPSKEKDKLIFRLLKKDLLLANKLLFELVSNTSVEEQREKIKEHLTYSIKQSSDNFYSPGYLNWDVRDMSGMITEHVKITKDKYGEISLNLYMINEVLEQNNKKILSAKHHQVDKFCTAVIARAFKIMLLIKKMHEDYLIEFKDELEKLANLIGDNPYLMNCAIHNGLDVNWLFFGNIPNDIEQTYKELRQHGYL